ncbi:cannabinoid receptor type 1B-like [Saccostrea echinata]|uniref:cannabinoid receptor type 1B-like n=1 Tax=Saccostrea echinata TaxID=191078 RepID=UPI002A83B966|nr:cannabinoid receptor type 1B-like [Saccostrea echinata]
MPSCLEYIINETAKEDILATLIGTIHKTDKDRLISGLVGFFIGGTAFILNVFVFITLIFSKELRQNTHLNLVLCLSIKDMVLGISVFVGGLRLFTQKLADSYFPCVLTSVLFISGITLSFCQTFLISFHRFLKISGTGLDKKLLQNNRKYVVYILFWIVVLGFNISMVQFRHVADKLLFCKFKCVFGARYPVMIIYFQSTAIILLSLTILFYVLTIGQMRQRYKRTFAWQAKQNATSSIFTDKVVTVSNSGCNQLINQMNKKLFGSMKLIGFIIAALLFCSGPMVFVSFFDHGTQKHLFIAAILSCLNSVVNPFIYAFNMENLRREWKIIWHMIQNL